MKVLNLRCAQEHRFEGWFGSELDFQTQQDRGLLTCPMCDSRVVVRLPSAPRLNVSRPPVSDPLQQPNERQGPRSAGAANEIVDPQLQAQARWWQAVRSVLQNTEDVGDRFPEEARRIHYGETKERGIRGRASAEDAQALKEEGIEVAALPLPAGLKGTVQ